MKRLCTLAAALALAGAAHAAGTVTFCPDASPEGFDIAQYETVATNDAAGLTIYDTLVEMRSGNTELTPGLAERWEVSADGTVYTLHLRKGVKFHSTPWFKPTREMNADDVLWSLNRLNDPKHPAHAAANHGFAYWAGMGLPALIKGIAKVDAYTVRITLARPEAPFLADLTVPAVGAVYSAEYGEQLLKAGKAEQLNTQPVGTGPFALKSYQKDAVIRYQAHTGYWGGAPKIDQLIFAITPDPAVRVQRVKAGECIVATHLSGDAALAFKGDTQVEIVRGKPLTTTYVAPNSQHKFLSDKRFREALSIAVDRATFAQSVYSGSALPAGSFLPPAMWSYDASLMPKVEIERAKQLVKASGYDGTELVLFATARDVEVKRATEMLQADWAKIGVKVRVQLMELGELYKRTGRGEHDLSFMSWFSDNGDPDNFLTPNLSCAAVDGGGNKARWCNAEFDKLLAEARAAGDIKKRTELYTKAQRLLRDETGLIPLAHRIVLTAVHKRVHGYIPTLFGGNDFRAARLD